MLDFKSAPCYTQSRPAKSTRRLLGVVLFQNYSGFDRSDSHLLPFGGVDLAGPNPRAVDENRFDFKAAAW